MLCRLGHDVKAAHERIVAIEDVAPGAVADACRVCRRVDDVGGEHRCQHAIGVDGGAHAGHELGDLVEQRRGVTDEEEMVAPASSTTRAPGMWVAR